jgi:F-type H+-transporting ATPase subunit a
MLVLIILSLIATRRYPKNIETAKNSELVPSGFGNFVEWVIAGLYGLAESVAGKWAKTFFPIVMTIFLFVIISNWTGLLPGVGTIGWMEHPHSVENHGHVAKGIFMTAEPAASSEEGVFIVPFFRAPSTDLNFTLALALVAVGLSQYFGIKTQKLGYFKKFINFSGFKQGVMMGLIMVFVGLLELIAEIARIISFSFRLFGNIFAGEVLLVVLAFLIPYIISLPFYGLEGFVGFIQAFVFFMLALIFFTLATQAHGGEGEHH